MIQRFLMIQTYSPLFDETRNRYNTIPPFLKKFLEVGILILNTDTFVQRPTAKKAVLKNFVKLARKNLCWRLILANLQAVSLHID